MIVIEQLMADLAKRRPVFCSEADFQHELAYEVRQRNPDLNVRLEWPVSVPSRGAIDLIVIGMGKFALELKYLCKGFSTTLDGEPITLKHQGAYDIRRYDVCKDVIRMERYAERTGHGAAVLVLSNDPAYWQVRKRASTADSAFDLAHLRELTGSLHWGETAGPGPARVAKLPSTSGEATPSHGKITAWRTEAGGHSGISGYPSPSRADVSPSAADPIRADWRDS